MRSNRNRKVNTGNSQWFRSKILYKTFGVNMIIIHQQNNEALNNSHINTSNYSCSAKFVRRLIRQLII